jgi:hypothetical protein
MAFRRAGLLRSSEMVGALFAVFGIMCFFLSLERRCLLGSFGEVFVSFFFAEVGMEVPDALWWLARLNYFQSDR